MKKKLLVAAGAIVAGGAIAVLARQQKPAKAEPIEGFELKKYLGKWYEIARLPYRYEKHLAKVTAEYSPLDDGSIEVLNSGLNEETGEREQAKGKAKFAGSENVGALRVSFFGPFYSGYNILAIDREYDNALVAGKNLSYLWLLSRSRTMPQVKKEEYLEIARQVGYDVDNLVWTKQD